MLSRKFMFCFAIVSGIFALTAVPAIANQIDNATATVNCNSYTLTVSGSDLSASNSYFVSYTITLTAASDGSTTTISGNIPVSGDSNGNFTATVTANIGPLSDNFTLDGSAQLFTVDDQGNPVPLNMIPITFSPNSLQCQGPPPPPPPNCVGQSTNTANFNGTPINPGSTIWFNSNFTVAGIPSSGATINFSSTIQLNGMTLTVPSAVITFSPSAGCASTSFDSSTNTWMTIVPLTGSDEIFLSGLAFTVPGGGIPGGVQNVAWNGNFSTNTPGLSIQWKWGAAVYSAFTDYNSLNVKATHQNACNVNNGDHAGTPENPAIKQKVIGGATGGGGSNWTGSWSGTVSVGFICQ